jgi:hypothetical protein
MEVKVRFFTIGDVDHTLRTRKKPQRIEGEGSNGAILL